METRQFIKDTKLFCIVKYATQTQFDVLFLTFVVISCCVSFQLVLWIWGGTYIANVAERSCISLSRLLITLLLTANGRSTSPLISTNGKFLQQYREANPVLDLSDNQCFLPASMASHHSRCLYAKGLFVLETILANPLHTTNYVATYASKEERAAAKYRVNAIFFTFPPSNSP